MTPLDGLLYQLSVLLLPVVIAVTFHEAAHAFAAWRLGDDTAYRLGRLTFNPIRHIDPFGTVVLPAVLYLTSGLLFGWAKPVPVNFRRLNQPRRDMVLVAIAGPASNLLLAVLSVWLYRWVALAPDPAEPWIAQNLINSVVINVFLAVFNMLPLPPLDGGRVAVGLLPTRLAAPLARLERYGLLILIGLLFLLPLLGRQLGLDLDIFSRVILVPVRWLLALLFGMAEG